MTASFTYPPGERTDRYDNQLTAATFATSPARVVLAAVPNVAGAWDVSADSVTVGTWCRTAEGAILEDPAGARVVTVCMLAGTSQAVTMGEGAHANWWAHLAGMVLAGNCTIDGATS